MAEALLCGYIAGRLSAQSLGNLAGKELNLEFLLTTIMDLVFGLGYNMISASVYEGVSANAEIKNQTAATTNNNAQESIFIEQGAGLRTFAHVYQ